MDRHSKICIIGAGMVGATSAFAIATHRIASELVIIDVNKERRKAKPWTSITALSLWVP